MTWLIRDEALGIERDEPYETRREAVTAAHFFAELTGHDFLVYTDYGREHFLEWRAKNRKVTLNAFQTPPRLGEK